MKITQTKLAEFLGVSDAFLSELRSGKKGLGKQKAKEIADNSNLSFEALMFNTGESLYKVLEAAYIIKNWDKQ